MLRPIIVLAAALALSACDVAGLVAHTVKQVEKSREQGAQPATARSEPQPQAQPAVQRQPVEEAPMPVSPVVPRPEPITVEALPPR